MTLGLFPLNLVLFPAVRIPLHIFEPRYKTLLSECLERGSEFGINLVDEGTMHNVGCAARVVKVTQRYQDGRMDVIVEGTGRYTLLDVIENENSYASGTVEWISDEDQATDTVLLDQCLTKYNVIVALVYGQGAHRFDSAEMGEKPSFEMAPKAGLAVDQKQRLLEMRNENERLELINDHLSDLLPMIQKAETIQRIVQSDGYLRAEL